MKKCFKCAKENLDEAIFYADCGTKLDSSSPVLKKCPDCGKDNPIDAIYCEHCTARLEDVSNNSSSDSDDSSSKSDSSSKKSFAEKYKEKPCLYWCFWGPMILFVIFNSVMGLINFEHGLHPEDYETSYSEEYDALDINNDGKLEFSEVNGMVSHTPQEKLYEIFGQSDKNGNGYLYGKEFDIYKSKAEGNVYEADYRKLMEEKERNASKKKGGRDYSSGSMKYANELNDQDFDSNSEGYVLTCPYCGSEAVYETGGYYKCAECGNSIYNPDELELGYGEGYMELLAPISSILP